MVLTIQKEVAETIVAKPGDMRLLSVSVQFYAKPEIVDIVPASCFYPVPKVDSAVLKVTPHSAPIPVNDFTGFFDLVRAGFSTPRKQLANSLAQGLQSPKGKMVSLLGAAGIGYQRRAETLSVEEWIALWRVFSRAGE
jgi:16S rRNA (adenine1518-N6/adenine1519-N6)-dimethyltransferase